MSYLLNSLLLTYLGLSHGQFKVPQTSSHSCPLSCFLPRLQKLGRLACPTRVRMMQRTFPEDWVHDTGRLVVIGSAAHPFPVRFALQPGG